MTLRVISGGLDKQPRPERIVVIPVKTPKDAA